MAKRITILGGLVVAVFLFVAPLHAQAPDTCGFSVSLDTAICVFGDTMITLDISFEGLCNSGGMQYKITTSPSGVLVPYDIDFDDTIIEDWEVLRANLSPDSSELKFLGIVNMPGGDDPPPLAPGSGLIGKLKCKYRCYFEDELEVSVIVDSVLIPDATGYDIYGAETSSGSVFLIGDTSIRGDANCDGMLIGSDITYLVNYFRAFMPCPCTLKAGDVNSDGMIIGSDITYLVGYFRGLNPPPEE